MSGVNIRQWAEEVDRFCAEAEHMHLLLGNQLPAIGSVNRKHAIVLQQNIVILRKDRPQAKRHLIPALRPST